MSIFNNNSEELPEVCQTIAEIIGYDKMIELVEVFDGEQVYFPRIEGIKRPARNQEIIEAYKSGVSYRDLAKKYHLTEAHIRTLIRETFNNSK